MDLRVVWTAVAVCVISVPVCGQGRWEGVPGPTLAEDLKTLQVPLVPSYAGKRPRLLFGPEDRQALREKARRLPEMWAAVIASSRRLGSAAPSSDEIRTGRTYWRIERVQSGALAYFVTGDRSHLDAAARWMTAHCREDTWGTEYRPNIDLQAAWYLSHISVAYDILHDDLLPEDARVVREGLASHAKAIFDSFSPDAREPYRYDQNHTYIPAVALATASLSLLGEVSEAGEWLKRAYAVMRRCRYVLGEDGYYYEGYGYWSYALHWHGRYADLMARATGKNFHDLPVLRNNWMYALSLLLPGSPNAFDMNDTGRWSGTQRSAVSANNYFFLWSAGKALNDSRSSCAADLLASRWPERDYPAAAFLAYDEGARPAAPALPAYHHFTDHDVVVWRSSWGDDATCVAFRCGPPMGHRAREKLTQMKDWLMNCGHVHPDIGGFWLYAKGTYLATDTGYTAEKWTKDHNTVLVDGKGQAVDGSYWNERGFPYEKLDACRIDRIRLTDRFFYVSGEYGGAYDRVAPGLALRRTIAGTKHWMVVVDEMEDSQAPHTLTWLCHSDAPFVKEGKAWIARQERASLAVYPLEPSAPEVRSETTVVAAGTGPGQATPTHRGYHLSLTAQLSRRHRLVTVLIPVGRDDVLPDVMVVSLEGGAVALSILSPQDSEDLVVDTGWTEASGKEPVRVRPRPRPGRQV